MKSKLLYVIVLVSLSINSFAQWQPTNGPYGANVRDIVIDGSNIYAATYGGGIYLSTDNCLSWSSLNNGLGNLFVSAVAIDGSKIFAGTDLGLYSSTNNGANWN